MRSIFRVTAAVLVAALSLLGFAASGAAAPASATCGPQRDDVSLEASRRPPCTTTTLPVAISPELPGLVCVEGETLLSVPELGLGVAGYTLDGEPVDGTVAVADGTHTVGVVLADGYVLEDGLALEIEIEAPLDDCAPPETTTTVAPTSTTVAPTSTTFPETTTSLPEVTTTIGAIVAQPAGAELPRTGSTVAPWVAAGAGLLLVGGAFLALSSKGKMLRR